MQSLLQLLPFRACKISRLAIHVITVDALIEPSTRLAEVVLCNMDMEGGDTENLHKERFYEMSRVAKEFSRRFYNSGCKELNAKIKTFPTNIINNMFGHFKKRDYFEVSEAEKAKIDNAPEVKF